MRQPHGYSIQVIRAKGPTPAGFRKSKYGAIDAAEATAAGTGLEVRVWDTKTARCVYSVPAAQRQEVA